MMAVWVVVVVLGVGAAAAAVASRRHADDVEPSVREFAEFRDAISRQVAGVHTDTAAPVTTRRAPRPLASASRARPDHGLTRRTGSRDGHAASLALTVASGAEQVE